MRCGHAGALKEIVIERPVADGFLKNSIGQTIPIQILILILIDLTVAIAVNPKLAAGCCEGQLGAGIGVEGQISSKISGGNRNHPGIGLDRDAIGWMPLFLKPPPRQSLRPAQH